MGASDYPPHCRMMREALATRGWEQVVLAIVMGRSESAVSADLTGNHRLTARLALDYGQALELSAERLLSEQDSWLLQILPRDEAKLAGIRRRAEIVSARVAGDRKAEIEALLKERAAIDERIAHLRSREVINGGLSRVG